MNDTIDVEPVEQTKALTVQKTEHVMVAAPPADRMPVTAAQAKVEAVANLTFRAYERASTLNLTPDEIKRLQADFPDDAFKSGAGGKADLIYIEHAHLRDRLNDVIGPGQWALIPRSRWAEDVKTASGKSAVRVYVEAMLVVRGAFVSEAVGEMEYWPNNASQNYGDAVEGAKTAAFRRCCKEFGIGLQAWKKDWCAGWWQRRNGQARQQSPAPAPVAAPVRQEAPPAASEITALVTVEMVTEKSGTAKTGKAWRAWFCLFSDGTEKLEGGTFSESIATVANELANNRAKAQVVLKPGRKAGSFEIVSLTPVTQVAEVMP